MTHINLHHLSVLVTRPKPKGEELCQLIRQYGGEAVNFPTVKIEPIILLANKQAEITEHDWLIFISPNAVEHFPLSTIPKHLQVAAVGPGTANSLINKGIKVTCYPQDEQGTEGLLKLPALQAINSKKMILVRGEMGRELLAETLIKQGAIVTHWVVYRRVMPKVDIKSISHLLRNHKIDIIVGTSVAGIRNLLLLLGKENETSLLQLPLIVVSPRMNAEALTLKFERIIEAKNASHESILEVLNKEKL